MLLLLLLLLSLIENIFPSKPTMNIAVIVILALLAVVTLQTFTLVKPIYLGQIHQKSPEVNSSRVLFYLGKNSGKVTLLISAPKIVTSVEFFGT